MKLVDSRGGIGSLKRHIIEEYVLFLKSELSINEAIYADPHWAKSGSVCHNECLKEKAEEIGNIQKQLKMLGKYDKR